MSTPAPDARDPIVAATFTAFLLAVRESGDPISADHRVTEAVAAALVGMGIQTLRNRRSAGLGPPFVRLPVVPGAGRLSYRLQDLAEFVHELRIDPRIGPRD